MLYLVLFMTDTVIVQREILLRVLPRSVAARRFWCAPHLENIENLVQISVALSMIPSHGCTCSYTDPFWIS